MPLPPRRLLSILRVLAWLPCLVALAWVGCGEDALDHGVDDTEPPDVVTTAPRDNDTWDPNDPIRVSFNEAVDAATVMTGIRIIGASVSVEYDAATLTATVTPTAPLEPGAAYTLVVQRVEDLAGNEMSKVQSISFTVAVI